ncbi:MAG: hypothetical protein ACK56R_03140, partial [Pirellulaceae bacterium]
MDSLKQDRANGLAGGAFESRGTTALESPKGEGVAGFWDDSAAREAVGSKHAEAAPLQISWG